MADDSRQSLKEMIVERLFLSDGPEDIGDDADLKASYDLESYIMTNRCANTCQTE